MRKKNYTMAEGNYYFNVKSGHQMITIYRKDKKTAVNTFNNYLKVGKDVEWLGCWDGNNFKETKAPNS